ncbi:unnamed protein product, partial [Mesorhabditis belari]|uniref:Uncharacterized protein n=1 Tax=Mesorhabditis belari TaxID=2138241 RepID=A0AAF3EYQ0_9BILA
MTRKGSEYDFAISVHFQHRPSETKSLLLIPGPELGDFVCDSGQTLTVMVSSDEFFTYVEHPKTTRKQIQNTGLFTSILAQTQQAMCNQDFVAITCNGTSVFSYYAGSSDGTDQNLENRLGSGSMVRGLYLRTTALSVLSADSCAFCAYIRIDPKSLSLDSFLAWTPYYYPWIFDRPLMKENIAKLVTISLQANSQNNVNLLVEAQQLFNVRVKIVGDVQGEKESFNSSFEHVEEFPLSISAYCLVITWEVTDANAEQIGFLLTTKTIKTLRKYTLTEETPTFVIHSFRISPEETPFQGFILALENFDDVIIDITRDSCDQWLDGNSSSSVCVNPTQFTINGRHFNMPDEAFGEKISWAVNLDDRKAGGYYWTQNFVLKQQKEFEVVEVPVSNSCIYAVSFRARNWVNETKKVLLIPETDHDNPIYVTVTEYHYVLVEEEVVVTLVPSFHVLPIPCPILKPINQISALSPNDCSKISESLNCDARTIFKGYAGGEPGRKRNPDHFIVEGRSEEMRLTSSSSATTLFTDQRCAFCLVYALDGCKRPLEPSLNFTFPLDDMVTLSQPFYPWIFDRYDWVDRTEMTALEPQEPHELRIEFTKFTRGTAEIALFNETNDIFSQNFTTMPEKVISQKAKVVRVAWTPDNDNQTDSGYMAIVRRLPACPVEHRLDVDTQPTLAFRALDLYSISVKSPRQSFCFGTCTNCTLLIEFSFYCFDSMDCDIEVPFLIDVTKPPKWDEECKKSFEISTQTTINSCKISVKTFLSLLWDYGMPQSDLLKNNSAFLISVPELLEESHTYEVFSCDEFCEVTVDKSSYLTTIVLVLQEEKNGTYVLTSLQSHPVNAKCQYDLNIQSLQNQNNTKDLHFLLTIDESAPFIEQYLENRVYSLTIPPGCSPKIVIEVRKYPSQLDRTNEQKLCQKGTAMIDSPGYLDPFINETFSVTFSNLSLSRLVICNDGLLLTVRGEVVALFDGTLQIDYKGQQGDIIASEIWHSSDDYTSTFNKTHEKVVSVLIIWTPNGTPFGGGALVLVHVDEVRTLGNDPPKNKSKPWKWIVPTVVLLIFFLLAAVGCAYGARSGLLIRLLLSHRNPFADQIQKTFNSIPQLKKAMDRALTTKKKFIDEWEISGEKLKIFEETLGAGAFAVVHRGYLQGMAPVTKLYPSLQLSYLLSNDGNDVAVKNVETITITTADEKDYVVNFSQLGCMKAKFSKCTDELPFSVNANITIDESTRRKRKIFTSLCPVIDTGAYLSTYTIASIKTLTFEMSATQSTHNFAISVHVQHWINETKSPFAIPGGSVDKCEIQMEVIVPADEIPIYLVHPNTLSAQIPSNAFFISFKVETDKVECNDEPLPFTCNDNSVFSTYAGSVPGKKPNLENLLYRGSYVYWFSVKV